MEMRRKRRIMVLVLMAMFGTGPAAQNALAQQGRESAPQAPNKHELAEAQVTQLLLLMDTDKNGKISKKEWMRFMEEEFDRLDTDKSGELDPKELAQSRIQASTFASMGK